ncbi:MAG: elongation factor Ts [Clostridia bacterium]|nr:elongation factor Ts [Clostridia bacterium]MBQ3058206.1 elongation factor Ts [Clostridia bacterium]
MAFTAKDVQALREKTGCGMMDCKKALVECDGNMDAAVDYLREKGLASQAKKADRIAAEGTVAVYTANGVGAIVELNSETDFVANGDGFKALAAEVAEVVATQNPADMDALLAAEKDGMTVEAKVQELFLAIRENIKVRRFDRFEGKVVSYVHAGGKIGVLVNFETELAADNEGLVTMGKNIAMQIAAMNPAYLDQASVPASVIEKEKEILVAQMKEDPKMANKPDAVLGKIVEGKIGKYYKENCLVEQAFVMDGDVTVGKYIANTAKELGADIKLAAYVRFEKGEGIEKRVDDFAAEVAAMAK